MRLGRILRLRISRVGVHGGSGTPGAATVAAAAACCSLAAGVAACAAQELWLIPRKCSKLVRARVWGSRAAAGAARLHEAEAQASALLALRRACLKTAAMYGVDSQPWEKTKAVAAREGRPSCTLLNQAIGMARSLIDNTADQQFPRLVGC